VIIVCDRYSAYKKLARLSNAILLAFCWAHVRRDFLNAAISFKPLTLGITMERIYWYTLSPESTPAGAMGS